MCPFPQVKKLCSVYPLPAPPPMVAVCPGFFSVSTALFLLTFRPQACDLTLQMPFTYAPCNHPVK